MHANHPQLRALAAHVDPLVGDSSKLVTTPGVTDENKTLTPQGIALVMSMFYAHKPDNFRWYVHDPNDEARRFDERILVTMTPVPCVSDPRKLWTRISAKLGEQLIESALIRDCAPEQFVDQIREFMSKQRYNRERTAST